MASRGRCKSTTRRCTFYWTCNGYTPPPARRYTRTAPKGLRRREGMGKEWALDNKQGDRVRYKTEFRGREVSKRRSLVEAEDGSQSCD